MNQKSKYEENSIEISLKGIDQRILFGYNSLNLKEIELAFPVKIVARGEKLKVYGETLELFKIRDLFQILIRQVKQEGEVPEHFFENLIRNTRGETPLKSINEDDRVLVKPNRDVIKPRSSGQTAYLKAIWENDLVFVIGPAGTGKTYLAVACAIRKLKAREIERIILVRPAVEAGESLGFLPGDMKEKVDPYLRPLYDALYEMLAADKMEKLLFHNTIEVAPLAYMRGRSLNNSFIILDEAQNTTSGQMKMLLTRLGFGSQAVITGDITQIDLPNHKDSGLLQVQNILKGISGIQFVYLDQADVVRHKLVQDIIQAYDKFGKNNRNSTDGD
ncbi:PhoH family protein [bacterium]|nr:PhoH family protein [bacterium]